MIDSRILSGFSRFSQKGFCVLSVDNARFLSFVCITFIAFSAYKFLVAIPAHDKAALYTIPLSLCISFAGIRIRASDMPSSIAIVIRTISGLFGIYILASFPATLLNQTDIWTRFAIEPGRYFSVACALAAFWRPTFVLAPLNYILWYKSYFSGYLGLDISYTDYMPLVEVGIYFSVTMITWKIVTSIPLWAPLAREENYTHDESALRPLEKIFLFGIAIHMANYFFSGYKKLWLGDNILSWVFENHTQNLIMNSEALGQLPISFSPALTNILFLSFSHFVVLSNFFILAGQLFALFALFRIRWAFWTTLFYDLTHIVIFIASGIFFYKWIILNFSIVAGLKTLFGKTVSRTTMVALVATILYAPHIFFVAKLGWWDTPALNIERFYAVTKDGEEIPIPSNYWGPFSVRFAQQRFLWEKSQDFLPTGTYGIVLSSAEHIRAEACNYDLTQESDQTLANYFKKEKALEAFIPKYHQWAVMQSGDHGNWLYDLYPHHIFSAPWEFTKFMKTDLQDIVTYRYSIKSVCMQYKYGRFESHILKEDFYDIPIQQQ